MEERKIAIVTGGTRGIGCTLVRKLIEVGFYVEFTYLNSAEGALELEGQYPGKCRGIQVDGGNENEVREYVKRITDDPGSRIVLLVNNAGITQDVLIKDSKWSDYERTMNSNLGATVNFCREVLPVMIRNRYGDIVNISSLASQNIRNGNAFYGTSKIAVERFSKSLALESVRFNVAVNVVAPGFVETDLIKGMIKDNTKKRELLKQIPRKKFTQPEEVADAVNFLISRKPLLIGAVLPLGGGGHLT